MMRKARPAKEVLPHLIGTRAAKAALRPRGRPKSERKKQVISIRLDADLLGELRASGPGWQKRVNDALRLLLVEKQS